MDPVPLARVVVRGFRSIDHAEFRPRALAALVGEASAGKSNLLAAIRTLLDPESAPLTPGDVARDGGDGIQISAEMGDGSVRIVEGGLPRAMSVSGPDPPPVLYLPAGLRTGRVVAPGGTESPSARRAAGILRDVISQLAGQVRHPAGVAGATEAPKGLVKGLESWHEIGLTGLVLLIEEPELFLPPQTQRYLYRILRGLADAGNQVIYSTHSPAFLNVTRLDDLVLTRRPGGAGTRLFQPEPLPPDDELRAYSEFDAARSELFLARAAVLVEGMTEKLAFPFVFRAMGLDPDRERISIIECGGKSNIVLVGRIARTVRVPFVAVHDRDAPRGRQPKAAERQLNDLIGQIAGFGGRVELAPDFEGVAGLRGNRHKPARAWRSFVAMVEADVPPPLAEVVRRAVAMARG